jgi:hypothetical protein
MIRRWAQLLLLVVSVVLIPHTVRASSLQARQLPPVQPGFPLLLDATSSYVYLSGLNAADLNGDGQKELIFGTRELDAANPTFGGFGCRGVVYAGSGQMVSDDSSRLYSAINHLVTML